MTITRSTYYNKCTNELSFIPPPPISTLFPYPTLFRSLPSSLPFSVLPASLRTRHRPGHAVPDSAAPSRGEGPPPAPRPVFRSEEHTSELQSRRDLVWRFLLEKKKSLLNTFYEADL